MVNVLKKHLIAYFIVLVDFLFVVSFVINIKKMTNVRQTFQISLTDINCARAQFVRFELSGSNPPPPPRLQYFYKWSLWSIFGGSKRQLLAVSWLVDWFEYVYQVVGEII